MSLSNRLLKLLSEPKYKYKGMPVSALGIPTLFSGKHQSLLNSVSRLKQRDLIDIKNEKIFLKPLGLKHIQQKMSNLLVFEKPVKQNTIKDLIVLFDIPEHRKSEREWFRFHLKRFNYEMIQKSVWIGPSPLPKDFIAYVKSIGLSHCVKILKLSQKQNMSF